MKKILFFSLFTLCAAGLIRAQSPAFAWARQFNGNDGSVLELDAAGNSYIAGTFAANSIVNIGGIVLNGSGSAENYFIARLDTAGNAVWARRMTRVGGLTESVNRNKIAVDVNGNVYLCGFYLPGATIDGQQIAASGYGYYLARFNSAGSLQWIKTITSADNIGGGISVFISAGGQARLFGVFNTQVRFTAGDSLTNTGNANGVDAFMALYDSSGSFMWARELGVIAPAFNPNTALPQELYRPDEEHAYIYRYVPSVHTVVRYDIDGNALMTRSVVSGGATLNLASFAVDGAGNFFLGGGFYGGNLNLEGNVVPKFGNGVYTDALLLKYDSSGLFQWVKSYNYAYNDYHVQVHADALGNVYAIGQHAALGGDARAILQKFGPDGSLIWEELMVPGPGGPNDPPGVVAPRNLVQAFNGGNILVLGYYRERIYFDASTSFSSPGVFKIFVAQYGICNTAQPLVSVYPAPEVCAGDSVQLSVSATGAYYQWATGDTGTVIWVNSSGAYYVVAAENQECYAVSQTVQVHVTAPPSGDITLQDNQLLAPLAAQYQWVNCGNGLILPGETDPQFVPQQNGNYAVILSSAEGCTDTTACFPVTFVSMAEYAAPYVSIYPNPAQNLVYLKAEEVERIEMFDISGKHCSPFVQKGDDSYTLHTGNLQRGVYYLRIWRHGMAAETRKLILQ